MKIAEWAYALEVAWDEQGFLGRIRMGRFDRTAGECFLQALRTIDLGVCEAINRRFVSLLWYIPLFLLWQRPRIVEAEGEQQALEYDWLSNAIQAAVEEILGIP